MPLYTPPKDEPPLIVQYDAQMNIITANEAALTFAGITTSDVRGMTCNDFWGHPADQRCQNCPLRLVSGENPQYSSLIRLHHGGNWWNMVVSQLFQENGKPNGAIAVFNKIDDPSQPRKPLDQLLEKQFLTNPTPQVFTEYRSGNVVKANHAFQELFGIDAFDLSMTNIYDTLELKQVFTEQVIEEIRTYGVTDGHLVKWSSTRHPKLLKVTGQRITIDNLAFVSFRLIDVTENESLRSMVARLENRFHSAFENAKVNVWEFDLTKDTFYLYDYHQHSGNTIRELDVTDVGREKNVNVHPDDRVELYERVNSLKAGISPIEFTYRIFNVNTHQIEYHRIIGQVSEWDENGVPVTAQGTITNVSELHLLKDERSRASILYNHLFQQSPVMILRFRHSDGIILDANNAFLDFCGLPLDQLVGKHPVDTGIWTGTKNDWDNLAEIFDQEFIMRDLQVPLTDKHGDLHKVVLSVSYGIWDDVPSSLAIGLDITDAHVLQQELLQTQHTMQNALDAINEGYFDLNLATNEIIANDNCYRLLGYLPREIPLSFTNWLYSIHQNDRKRVVERFRALRSGEVITDSFRIRMLQKNGESVHVFYQHKVAEFDQSGKPLRVVGTITDLSEQIKVEQELLAQKETLEATFNAIDEGIWEFNLTERTMRINDRCKELIGLWDIETHDYAFIESLFSEIIHPEDLANFTDCINKILHEEKSSIDIDIRIRKPDGVWRWFNIRGGVLEFADTDTNQNPERIVGALTDITARKEMDRRLRLLEAGVEQSSVMAFLFRPDGSIQYVNQYAIDELGYTPDEFRQLKVYDLDPDFSQLPDKESVWEMNKNRIKQELSYTLDVNFIRKNRSVFPATVDFRYVEFEDEQYYWTLVKDVSDLKEAEKHLLEERESLALRVEERTQELAATNEFLDLIIQNLPIPVYFKDENLRYIEANQAFADFFGYRAEEIIGKEIFDMVREEIANDVMADDQRILETGGRIQKLSKLSNSADELRDTVLMKKGFIHPQTGKHGIVGTFIDITDRIDLQNQLEQSNQELNHAMKVKDEFLANMSHEFRTPLTSIIGYSEMLLTGLAGKLLESQQKYIEQIVYAGKHLLTLINDILDYSKFNAEVTILNREKVRVRSVCVSAISIMEPRAFKKDIQIDFEIENQIGEFWCDPQRLRQILINLLNNAIKFSPNYGTIGLRVKTIGSPKPAVEFQVWDRGIGIEPEDLTRIFEPFTQVASDLERDYEGSGIGLALVKKFVELHDGAIRVESTPGEGSTFYVQIPIIELD